MSAMDAGIRTKWFVSGLAAAAIMLAVAGASPAVADSQDPAPEEKATYYDPLETMNRGIFAFNQAIDEMLLKPAA